MLTIWLKENIIKWNQVNVYTERRNQNGNII